ncbi:homeobox even-skipped homolog protein 1-like [Hyalella azteca]|uniref:Homeobox even-skipped homolog protein 1-like n=1 Tax=Hyalella azteca TaxID=294128 RepID=A0A8B7NYI6_HYAAZ|nr:homeobox even-skipped homolog protein 1-like [Hyalella azteca]
MATHPADPFSIAHLEGCSDSMYSNILQNSYRDTSIYSNILQSGCKDFSSYVNSTRLPNYALAPPFQHNFSTKRLERNEISNELCSQSRNTEKRCEDPVHDILVRKTETGEADDGELRPHDEHKTRDDVGDRQTCDDDHANRGASPTSDDAKLQIPSSPVSTTLDVAVARTRGAGGTSPRKSPSGPLEGEENANVQQNEASDYLNGRRKRARSNSGDEELDEVDFSSNIECQPKAYKRSNGPDGASKKSTSLESNEIRRYRTAFSKEQISALEKEFNTENYVSRPRRSDLAKELGLPESTIKVWFQNRRMKDKRMKQNFPWPIFDTGLGPLLVGLSSPFSSHPLPQMALHSLPNHRLPLYPLPSPLPYYPLPSNSPYLPSPLNSPLPATSVDSRIPLSAPVSLKTPGYETENLPSVPSHRSFYSSRILHTPTSSLEGQNSLSPLCKHENGRSVEFNMSPVHKSGSEQNETTLTDEVHRHYKHVFFRPFIQ